MNLTYAEAIALGGSLAAEARRLKAEPRKRPKSEDGMNKTERRFYDEVLDVVGMGRIRREILKFRLAGRTFYTPDFVVRRFECSGQRLTCVEVKGFMRDDAAVKLKTAASLYPEFRWLLVRACKGGWDVREVTDRGIGRERIAVAWIPGSE